MCKAKSARWLCARIDSKAGVDHEGCRINRPGDGHRGLGLAFAKGLVEMGAAKVYAAARNPEAVTLTGVVPLNHSRFTYQRHD